MKTGSDIAGDKERKLLLSEPVLGRLKPGAQSHCPCFTCTSVDTNVCHTL